MKTIEAVPTIHGGITMRSRLEAGWAASLDQLGIVWQYEPKLLTLPSGVRYLPDFWLPEICTVLEVKGTGIPRTEKTIEYARALPDVIVLLGFEPSSRALTDCHWEPFLVWREALGYDTRLALCPACNAWQWLRPQLSRACRKCSAPHYGLLAKPGEMRFTKAVPERPALKVWPPL